MPTPVEQSIRVWQEDNNIEMSAKAFQLLVDQVETACANCTETYHFDPEGTSPSHRDLPENASVTAIKKGAAAKAPLPKEPTYSPPAPPPTGDLRRMLRESYLDQLRDINMAKGKKIVIESADIMAYTFSAFLKDIGFYDAPFGSLGRLIVESDPKTADIKINGKRKGYTNKRFVVRTGSYRVEIDEPTRKLSCDTTVLIGDSEEKTVVCKPTGS